MSAETATSLPAGEPSSAAIVDASTSHNGHAAATATAASVVEPTYSAKEQQLLADMRQQLAARLSSGKLEPAADFKPPHHMHWRDIYSHYRHLTSVEATPDPRINAASASAPPLPTPQDWPNYQLYRFLKAREFNVKRGADMLLGALYYRQQFGADDLLQQPACPFKEYQRLFMRDQWHYTDQAGHPLILNNLGGSLLERLGGYYPAVLAYVTEVVDMEHGLALQRQSSEALGRRITLFSVILDTKGVTLAHRELIPYMNPVLWTEDNIFPENMHQLLVGHAPSVVSALWNIIQVFIDKQTRAKFVFLPHGKEAEVSRLVGAKETPVEWGGQCDRCGGQCTSKLTNWDEGWRRLGRGTAEEVVQWEGGVKEQKVDIAARYDHEVRLKVDKQKADGELERVTVWWSFRLDAKDLDFSLSFEPAIKPPPHTSALLTPTYHLVAPTRVQADAGSVHRGCHHFTVRRSGVDEGVAILKLSNAMSTFSSKTAHVKAGVVHGTG